MKKLITLLFLTVGLVSFGQTTVNPDTVCINATGEQYFVTNSLGSTYSWTTTGTLTSGGGTNAVTIDWGGVPGLYPNAVTVTETTQALCTGNPVTLDVYILELLLLAAGDFCITDPSYALITNIGGGILSGNGIIGGDFDPSTAGVGTHVVTYSLGGCSVTTNVTVNNVPITGPIQHY